MLGQAGTSSRQTRRCVLEAPVSIAPGEPSSTPSVRYNCHGLAARLDWDSIPAAPHGVLMDPAAGLSPDLSPGSFLREQDVRFSGTPSPSLFRFW